MQLKSQKYVMYLLFCLFAATNHQKYSAKIKLCHVFMQLKQTKIETFIFMKIL